jgi:hypothetical protein
LKEEIGEMRDDEMAAEKWENEGGHTLTKYAIARFVRAFQSRLEADSLGDVSVPAVALYGVQTQRALGNFRWLLRSRRKKVYENHQVVHLDVWFGINSRNNSNEIKADSFHARNGD